MSGRYVAGRDIHIHEARPAPQALYQLPPDIREFTNRDTEQAELIPRLGEDQAHGAMAILVLTGKPGVGKSALAIRVAHRVAPRFGDAQLYADLRGADAGPLDPHAVLAEFLRALGVAGEAVPSASEERAAAYRARLAGKRALIVLDNAADERQIRPLVPGDSTCAVLITSRSPLGALEGGQLRAVDVLDRAAAIELLAKLAGPQRVAAEPAAADTLAHLCGDLPLALRIAGGLLAEKPVWTLAMLAARLNEEGRRLDELRVGDREVRGGFAVSYRELSDGDARLFRRLGALSGVDFAPDLAAALTDSDSDAAEQALERLVDAQLVEAPAPRRYRFHDLVRVFARECLHFDEPPGTRDDAASRARVWYRDRAEGADWRLRASVDVIRAALGDEADLELVRAEALSWLVAERANLVLAVTDAHGAHDWTTTYRLADALTHFWFLGAHWDEWQRSHELALEAAQRADDRYGEAEARGNLGRVYFRQGRWKDAVACFEQSLTDFRRLGDRHGEARTLTSLGPVYFRQGRWQDAIACYERSLPITRELGDRHGEAQTLTNLGHVRDDQGHWQDAVACYEQSLNTSRELGDRHGEARTLTSLGIVYFRQGRWQDAIACYEESLPILREFGDRHGDAQTLANLGHVHASQGRWQDAAACYERSMDGFRELGDRHGESQTLNSLGMARARQGRWQDAIAYYEQSLTTKREFGDRQGEAQTLTNLGNAYAAQERWQDAAGCFEQSLTTFRELGDRHGEAQTLLSVGVFHTSQGRWQDAIAYYSQSLRITQELGDREGEALTHGSIANVYLGQRRWREAIASYERSLTSRRQLGNRHGEALTLYNLALAFEAIDDVDSRAACLREALRIFDDLGAPESEQTRARLANAPKRRWRKPSWSAK